MISKEFHRDLWQGCAKRCVFFLALFSICSLYGLKVGSDTAVSSEPFVIFPATDDDNEILGFAWMDKGFALPDATTTCTFSSFFPVRGPIQLNCGTLWLDRDLIMHNITTFTCMGNIRATTQQALELANGAAVFGCIEQKIHRFENVNLVMNSNVVLHSYIKFYGDNTIEGRGHLVDLDDTGSFIIASNSSLTLNDMTIANFCNGNVICEDNSSQLVLYDVNWKQKDVYRFEQGSILFKGDVSIIGTSTFIYDSSYTSTIDTYSQLRIADDLWIELGRDKDTLQEPLYFTDNSSTLFLDGCHLVVTDSGIQFSRGKITVADDVTIDLIGTVTQTGLILGKGDDENDVELILKPGSTITHSSGYLVYNNLSASKFHSLSPSARFLRQENSKLAVQQDFEVNNLIIEAESSTVSPAEIVSGKVITYKESTVRFPSFEVTVNAQQTNALIYMLDGDSSLFLTKGTFPLFIAVSGTNNTIRGNGVISGAITLADSATELTWDFTGALSNTITFSDGTLLLDHPMDLIGSGNLIGPGVVNLGTDHLAFKKMFTTTTPIYWKGSMNSHIVLCCNNSLSSTWTVQGQVTLNGQGNELSLVDGSALVVEKGSQLVLKDITLTGIKENNVRCLDDDASIKCEDTFLVLDSDYTVTTGSFFFHLDTHISGTNSFTYDSTRTSTINKNSTLTINGGTFSIGRKDILSSVEPLRFADHTSMLILEDSTLSVGNQGMQLTNGTMRINGEVTLDINSTSTVNGLMLGDGIAADDFKIELGPSALLTLNPGHLIYNVTNPYGISTQAKTARIIHQTGFSTYYLNDFIFKNVTVQLNPFTSFILAPDVQSKVADIALDTPFGSYRITGSRHSVGSINLEGNGDYLFVDTQTFPFDAFVSGTSNTIGGEGDVTGQITLQDDATEVTMQLSGLLKSSPIMNGGTIMLNRDLHLANGALFTGVGTVDVDEYDLHFGAQMLQWSGGTNWVINDGALNFHNAISLTGTWTFNGSCIVHGNGHTIDLGDTGAIWINSGSSVMFHELQLQNAKNVRCHDNSSVIILDDSTWCQHDADSIFSDGALRIKNKVEIHGNGTFIYSTSQTSTIHSNARLMVDEGMTFSYDPSTPVKDLLLFEDMSAQLILKTASLYSTATGMQLKKGTLGIKGKSSLASDVITIQDPIAYSLDEGITFGSGTVEDDFTCIIQGGSSLPLTQGTLVYNNTDPDLIIFDSSVSLLKIAAQARLTLEQSLRLTVGGIEFGNNATLLIKNGKNLTASIFPLGTLFRRSKA